MAQRPTVEDVATSPAGWRRPEPDAATDDQTFAGFHDTSGQGDVSHPFHFEVFYDDPSCAKLPATNRTEPGWFWWPCFPGCLPDGEPNGPFPTAEGAYLDAIGE